MESRAAFKEIGSEFRSGLAKSGDTGFLTQEMGYQNPGPTPNLRGVERNTARGVTDGGPVLKDIIPVDYAACTDQPIVDPFKVYGEY